MCQHPMLENLHLLMAAPRIETAQMLEFNLRQHETPVERFWHCRRWESLPDTLDDLQGQVDAAVVDYTMLPSGREAEAVADLAEQVRSLPFVVCNGPADFGQAADLVANGAADYLAAVHLERDRTRLRHMLVNAIVRQRALEGQESGTGRAIPLRLHQRIDRMRQANAELRERQYELEENYTSNLREQAEQLRARDEMISWLTGGYSVQSA